MKNACEKWKDRLLEAALSGAPGKDLEEHLRSCQDCAAELKNLKARREKMDALLPLIAQGAEPSPHFRTRVLAEAALSEERKGRSGWRAWALAGAITAAVTVLAAGVAWRRETAQKIAPDEIATAQKLAEWQAPSDSLLKTPGQEILRKTPKVGESYLKVPMKKVEEE